MERKKRLTQEEQKQLLLLKSQLQMQAKTREEALLRGKKESVERMDIILNGTLTDMAKIDPSFADRCRQTIVQQPEPTPFDLLNSYQDDDSSYDEFINNDLANNTTDSDMIPQQNVPETSVIPISDNDESGIDVYDLADKVADGESVLENIEKNNTDTDTEVVSFEEDLKKEGREIESFDKPIHKDVDPDALYDEIPLPSHGECYKNKKSTLKVAYLTAADENLFTSPNLYESGKITNMLLKRKVKEDNFNTDELVAGDVDAIMVFLRGTAYGTDFPIQATDPKTKKTIDTVVDLRTLNYKSFVLKGDEEGLFEYTLPISKSKIKFKFLTKRDNDLLNKLNKKENSNISAYNILEAIDKIKSSLKADTRLSDVEKNGIIGATDKLQKWYDVLSSGNKPTLFSKAITNAMEMQIVEIDGIRERQHIHNCVMNMKAGDSLAFRRFIYDNAPGVNFEVDVNRPESMGGGSFKCFLDWNDYVFWLIQ